MPRGIILLIVLIVLIAGGLYLLSRQAEEVPARTIETEVVQDANAQ